MKNILNKALLVVVLLLSVTFLFACGEKEPTEMEKILTSVVTNCQSATVETTIKLGEATYYSEVTEYTYNGSNYDKVTDIEQLATLEAEGNGKNHEETTVNKVYSLELKEEYFASAEASNGTINCALTEQGTKAIIGAGATNANITVKADNGKITEINISYVMNGQNVVITARYQY